MPRNRNKTPCSVTGWRGRPSRSLDWPQLGEVTGSLPTLGTVVQSPVPAATGQADRGEGGLGRGSPAAMGQVLNKDGSQWGIQLS